MNDQDSSTAMLRGMMDNVALTNSPRQGYVQGQVNVDDLMNNEIGGLVRMKSPQALVDIATPFVAGQVLTAMQYMDAAIEGKTGVTKASMGLDPDALQNTSATAARLQAQQGSAQIEVMARNIAEGGMKRLFKLMLHLLVEHSCEEVLMRLHGEFVPLDPRSWNTNMDMTVNVGLGTGREEARAVALNQALSMQMQILESYQLGLINTISRYIYMYIYIYYNTYIYIYICTSIYIYIYIYMHVCKYITYIYIYIYVHEHI